MSENEKDLLHTATEQPEKTDTAPEEQPKTAEREQKDDMSTAGIETDERDTAQESSADSETDSLPQQPDPDGADAVPVQEDGDEDLAEDLEDDEEEDDDDEYERDSGECLLTAQYKFTEDEVVHILENTERFKKSGNAMRVALVVICGLLAVVNLADFIRSLVVSTIAVNTMSIFFVVVCILLILLELYLPKFTRRRIAVRVANTEEYTTSLYERKLLVRVGEGMGECWFADVPVRGMEDGVAFYILPQKDRVFAIPKRVLDAEQCETVQKTLKKRLGDRFRSEERR